MRKVRFAIIGAGTVGLTALGLIRKQTDDFVLIEGGALGTTCARVGCMPSKALIHAASHYHHAVHSDAFGVIGGENLAVDQAFVMARVRRFRDRFTSGIEAGTTQDLDAAHFIRGYATLTAPNRLIVNGEQIEAERIIIGTGSTPVVPAPWRDKLGARLLTSDNVFDLTVLPRRVAVIGLGVIGLELGQALSRLGVEVIGFEAAQTIGGLTHPDAIAQAIELISREFPIHLGQAVDVDATEDSARVHCGKEVFEVDAVLVSIGRRANLNGLGLEHLGVPLDASGRPPLNPNTMQVADLPVFIAGDASSFRPILHEAGEEGRIATLNAMNYPQVSTYRRKTPLGITFSEPGMAFFGERYIALDSNRHVSFSFHLSRNNGRAIVMDEDQGVIVLYADRATQKLVGGELVMSRAEHFAHALNWLVELELTLDRILDLPFYHPVLEEAVESALKGLRAALRT
ncbi:MAG: dihydrolipoyl dehydrogenase [Thiomicrospira sp.]